jgi:hypothetical protein
MLGRKERSQLELFISGSLRQLIPDDHVLVRVERVLDLSWLRDEVADCYCLEDGRHIYNGYPVFSLETLDGDQRLTGGRLNEETGSILMSGPVSTNVCCVRRCNKDCARQRMKNRSCKLGRRDQVRNGPIIRR